MHRLRVISHYVKPAKRTAPCSLGQIYAEVVVYHPSQRDAIIDNSNYTLNVLVKPHLITSKKVDRIVLDDPLVDGSQYKPGRRISNEATNNLIRKITHNCGITIVLEPEQLLSWLASWKISLINVMAKYNNIESPEAQKALLDSIRLSSYYI